MEASIGTLDRQRLQSERNFLRALSLVLGVLSIFLSGIVLYQSLSQMTHVIPLGAQKPYMLGRGVADREYVTDLAYEALSLWGNVTPENIGYNKERLLRMADAEGNVALRVDLDAAEKRIKQDSVSTIWGPRDAEVNLKARTVTVRGFLRTYINNVATSNVEKRVVVDYFISGSGQAYVRNLKEIKENAK